jgi:hypothetical protein
MHPLRWLKNAAALLVALLILFEEWGWEPLQAALGRLARLPALARLERSIEGLPPAGAVVVFFAPALGLLPVKIGALWLIGAGHPGLGLGLIVAAKVVGTAIVARLFRLTRPALMSLPWFARLHAGWLVWKERMLALARATALWRRVRAWRRRVAAYWRAATR